MDGKKLEKSQGKNNSRIVGVHERKRNERRRTLPRNALRRLGGEGDHWRMCPGWSSPLSPSLLSPATDHPVLGIGGDISRFSKVSLTLASGTARFRLKRDKRSRMKRCRARGEARLHHPLSATAHFKGTGRAAL
ncbi:hypothetical protein NDU88_000939 [Pleurodeles waltl]|uniref:Uncharacterized protein n=1 Tax=Pleurodeles waltl TaxID=8319 RepID=A0AAV7MIA0_PLEWA|nr:hypothetical protein NDU88_000939 [Pleurodeles waltl]